MSLIDVNLKVTMFDFDPCITKQGGLVGTIVL